MSLQGLWLKSKKILNSGILIKPFIAFQVQKSTRRQYEEIHPVTDHIPLIGAPTVRSPEKRFR
jgi:hypothetical protein